MTPPTLLLGAAIILGGEALVAVDALRRGVAVLPAPPGASLAAPQGWLEGLARWTAVHMTPLCWTGYLLVFDGLLGGRAGGSPARTRPRRFWTCFVTSVGVWVFFDWVNFSFIHAWDYHFAEPLGLLHGWIAKVVAFGAISPAMFVAAELVQGPGAGRWRGRAVRIGPAGRAAMVIAGAAGLLFPFFVRDPVGCLTLWVALVLLLDPVNHALGAPSLIGDWAAGRYGRTLSLMLGGLFCGFLWEFWNYWAAAKWTYSLPFLGPMEHLKLFEMPIPGFAGFPPFALECWVAFQTIVLVLEKLRPGGLEPLPADAVL